MTIMQLVDRLAGRSILRRRERSSRPRSGRIASRATRNRRRRAILEPLESRRLLAELTVTSAADNGPGSLRDAIAQANATAVLDTISFDNSLTEIVLASEISITRPVIVQGPGSNQLQIRAAATPADEFRVFGVADTAGNVSIEGVTLTGGRVTAGAGGGIEFLSSGTLTIRNSVVTGNTANNGGGIYNGYDGIVSIVNSTISGNTATFNTGGGIHSLYGNVTIDSSDVSDNTAYASGGGISSPGTGAVTVTNSRIANNRVTTDGYHGGGIYSVDGAVTISGSTISGNTAPDDGGGVYSLSGAFTVQDSVITNNRAGFSGGGILNYSGTLTVSDSTFTGNESVYGDGGAIWNNSGKLTLTRSTITGNQVDTDGAGIANGSGPVVIADSVIASNSAAGNGGGIATTTGPVTLTNTTVSGNTASVQGGGIQSDSAALRLVHATVTGNQAQTQGGGIGVIANNDGESLLAHNSIIAANIAPLGTDLMAPGAGAAFDVRFNFIGSNSLTGLAPAAPDANGNFIGDAATPIDPMLGPLADNGGPTLTHALMTGSAALDSANNALSISFGADGVPGGNDDVPLTSDQRGCLFARTVDSGSGNVTSDMGAFEFQTTPMLIVDTAEDIDDGDLSPGDRSLRELIACANRDPGLDLIQFAASLPSTLTLDPALGPLVTSDTLTIAGPGADQLTLQHGSSEAMRLIEITSDAGDVQIRGMTLQGGKPDGDGGAILSHTTGELALVGLSVQNNSATHGGAVASTNGKVTVAASTLTGNTATGHGGAVAGLASTTDVEILDATLSGNSASSDGGAVYVANAVVSVSSSTIVSNTAGGVGGGVGLSADGGGESLKIQNSVIAGNTAQVATDFLAPLNTIDLTVMASLIGDNDSTTLTESQTPDANGNLIGGSVGGAIDPLLGPLADHGGPTLTHQPLDGSPVIDAGNALLLPTDRLDLNDDGDTAEALPQDQRGAARVTDALDMGAVELAPIPTVMWNNPADIVFGTPLGPAQLNATSPVSGMFVYAPGAGTVLFAGDNQPLSVRFTPDDPLAFRAVTVTVAINVLKADPVITWNNPDPIEAGTPLGPAQLNATADVSGTFVYTPPAGTVLGAGQHTLTTTFTPDDTDNYNVVQASVTIDVLQMFDFGDAPSVYPVTLAQDGARHVAGTLTLGTAIDTENDGQPSAAADGDGADDDGVTPLATAVAISTVSTTSSFLVDSSAAARLDAWVDFNGNGSWDDAGEQIATNVALNAGTNVLSYPVPAGASPGTTAARFRLSTAGGLSPTGAAADGEVEDYIVTLVDGSTPVSANVDAPGNTIVLDGDATTMVIGDGQTELFRTPVNALAGVQINGPAGQNQIVVNRDEVDFTSTGDVHASQFQQVDLRNAMVNKIRLDAAVVAAMSPATQTVTMTIDGDDRVDFADADDWRVTGTSVDNGSFFQTATNQVSGESVRFDTPVAWTNPIRASDVNNDGFVTARDALQIIGELVLRRFSDPTTQDMNDPLTQNPWPGIYFDQNGDLKLTPLDALRVINDLVLLNPPLGEGVTAEPERPIALPSEPMVTQEGLIEEVADKLVDTSWHEAELERITETLATDQTEDGSEDWVEPYDLAIQMF